MYAYVTISSVLQTASSTIVHDGYGSQSEAVRQSTTRHGHNITVSSTSRRPERSSKPRVSPCHPDMSVNKALQVLYDMIVIRKLFSNICAVLNPVCNIKVTSPESRRSLQPPPSSFLLNKIHHGRRIQAALPAFHGGDGPDQSESGPRRVEHEVLIYLCNFGIPLPRTRIGLAHQS